MKIHLHQGSAFAQATLFKVPFLILLLSFISAGNLFAQLNGLNYTINPGNAASATNYQSIADAVSDLSAGTRTDGGAANGPGISGPVKITVTAGTYTYSGQIFINAVTGAGGHGGADSIIFDGGSASASTLTQSTPSGNNTGFYITNASYITIKNFTLTATSPINTANSGYNFWGIAIAGSPGTVSHDDVINCTINMSAEAASAPATPGAAAQMGIVVDGETSTGNNAANVSGYFSNIYLTGNTITNGHNGIYAFGSGADPSGVNIVGNTITGFSTMGVCLFNLINPKIKNNVINGGISVLANGANLGRGISMNTAYNAGSTTDWTEISGNYITFLGRYGILLNGVNGTSSQPTRIFNNMVFMSGKTVTAANGISTLNSTFSPGNNYINFWNNSICLNDSSTQNAFTLVAGSTNSDIRNNIFAYIGTSTGYPVNINAISEVTAFDYNIFYNPATNNEGSIGNPSGTAAVYTNSGVTNIINNNYGGTTTFNANSAVANPNFVSTTPGSPDLHITSQATLGIQVPGVTTDIDGQPRNNPPNIGADEIARCSLLPDTAGPISVTAQFCPGNQGVVFSVAPINGATGYSWTVPAGDTIVGGKNTNAITVDFSLSLLGGTVTVNGTNNCGSGVGSAFTVNIHIPAVISVSPAGDTLCAGNSVSLSVTAGLTGYTWLPVTALSSSTSSTITVNPSSSVTYTVTAIDGNGCTVGTEVAITVETCTAIAPVVTDREISVFPNPANGQFVVSFGKVIKNGKAEIFNITGQKVYGENFTEKNELPIDLTRQGKGIYFLRVTDETESLNTKIVVQ